MQIGNLDDLLMVFRFNVEPPGLHWNLHTGVSEATWRQQDPAGFKSCNSLTWCRPQTLSLRSHWYDFNAHTHTHAQEFGDDPWKILYLGSSILTEAHIDVSFKKQVTVSTEQEPWAQFHI